MNDKRMKVFRTAIDGLIESLEAVIRLSRWKDAEAAPDPLIASAAQLPDRLGDADRLTSTRFNGPATDLTVVNAICAAMKRLAEAHKVYLEQLAAAPERADEAAATLETEIVATTDNSSAWR